MGESFINKKQSNALVLTPDDIDIFQFLCDHRFLRREHLQALTGRTAKPLHRRLLKLQRNGYLCTTPRTARQKFIYGLREQALAALVGEGRVETEMLEHRIRTNELSELFLRHEMMIIDLHVVLSLARKSESMELKLWLEGPILFDSVVVSDHRGARRLPVRPDAFFTITDPRREAGANLFAFALEADRSTADHKRMANKFVAYRSYIEQRLYLKKYEAYGLHSSAHPFTVPFRVLTVTRTNERAQQLNSLVKRLLPDGWQKFFRFTSVKNFSLENPTPIFGDIWLSPRTPGLHPLIAPPRPPVAESTVNV